jgi:xanthine dehydrogenase YagS FAD-binding subunit
MRPFSYARPASSQDAISNLKDAPDACFIAGGTTLIDLMKLGVESPNHLIDVNRLEMSRVEDNDKSVVIGSLISNQALAEHEVIEKEFPVLSQALLSGATVQLRNMATVGGNLLQRTRCYYFRDTETPCNKREPGSGCPALEGFNRIHAILGTSSHCIASNPSDMSVALSALEAVVWIKGPGGERKVPIVDFHLLPGDTPHKETVLEHGELITAVEIPKSSLARQSHYEKVRDRASYAFALVSVAAAMETQNGKISAVRIGLGSVAPKPWRATKAEAYLIGKPVDAEYFRKAGEIALEDAQPKGHNKFKVELAKRTIVRALSILGGVA